MLDYDLFLPIVNLVNLVILVLFSWKNRSTVNSDRQLGIAIAWSSAAVFMIVVSVFAVVSESYLYSVLALLTGVIASMVALYFNRMDIDNKAV